MKKQVAPFKNQKGFGMIEVLVAFVIVSVGLLGLGTIQLFSIKNINNSQYRTLATLYAYDMAERMRSNKAALGEYDGIDTSSSCSSCSTVTQSDFDDWVANLTQALDAGGLPNAVGTISVNAGLHEITIAWDEVTRDDSGGLVNTESYTLFVGI